MVKKQTNVAIGKTSFTWSSVEWMDAASYNSYIFIEPLRNMLPMQFIILHGGSRYIWSAFFFIRTLGNIVVHKKPGSPCAWTVSNLRTSTRARSRHYYRARYAIDTICQLQFSIRSAAAVEPLNNEWLLWDALITHTIGKYVREAIGITPIHSYRSDTVALLCCISHTSSIMNEFWLDWKRMQ